MAAIECGGRPFASVLSVSFSYSLCRVTPLIFAIALSTASNGVRDGKATLCDCLTRSSASVSAATPTVAASGLVTEAHPRVGVLMPFTDPATAATAPLLAHVAVATTVPSVPITTVAGRFQITLLVSRTEPLVMVVPTVPVSSRSTVELVAARRVMPLILTLLVSASPTAVAGENDR